MSIWSITNQKIPPNILAAEEYFISKSSERFYKIDVQRNSFNLLPNNTSTINKVITNKNKANGTME